MSAPPAHTSPSQITRQLLRNSALMVLSRVAGILTLLISVPFIIHYLGDAGFGVWESLLAIGTVALVLQAVISSTILWRISACFGLGHHAETRRLVRVGISMTCLLLAVAMPLVCLLRERMLHGLQLTAAWRHDADWAMPALVATMIIGGVNQVLLAVLNGYQRAGQAALIQSFGLLATHAVAILVLWLGGALQALPWGYAIGNLAMLMVLYPSASRLCGRISMVPVVPTRLELSILGPFATLLLLSNLTLIFRDQADKLLLASLNSPVVTGHFGIGQRLAGLIMQSCAVVCTPLTATIGAEFAAGNWMSVQQVYARAAVWMASLAGLMGFLITVLRQPLLVLWLGKAQVESHTYLGIAVFGVVSAIVFSGAGVAVAKGIGKPGLETACTLVTLILVLLSKPLLIANLGAVGSVVSSSCSWCLGSALFLIVLHRSVPLPNEVAWRSLIVFLVTVALSGGGWWLTNQLPALCEDRWSACLVLLLAMPPLGCLYMFVLFAAGALHLRPASRPIVPGRAPTGLPTTPRKTREYESEISCSAG